MADQPPKRVAPRNDLKPTEFVKQRPALFAQDPDFAYQWMHTDPRHPCYVGKYLRPHEVGDHEVGYTVADPWETVSDMNDPGLKLRNPRDDQGKGIDTVRRQGEKVLCRTPLQNARKYEDFHNARVAINAKGITAVSSPDHPMARSRVAINDESSTPHELLGRA